MSERYTKKDAEKAFERLCELMGVKANPQLVKRTDGHGYMYQEDGWRLDYAACYGGYVVASLSEGTTGEGRPFGDYRRSARDLWQMVWDITRAFELRSVEVGS